MQKKHKFNTWLGDALDRKLAKEKNKKQKKVNAKKQYKNEELIPVEPIEQKEDSLTVTGGLMAPLSPLYYSSVTYGVGNGAQWTTTTTSSNLKSSVYDYLWEDIKISINTPIVYGKSWTESWGYPKQKKFQCRKKYM